MEVFNKYRHNLTYYNGISNENIEQLSNLYRQVKKSEIFFEKDFEIISYRYHQIHKRDYLPDIIIDALIVLEMLFTRKMKEQIRSHLSQNCALFIAESPEEYERFNKLLKEAYELRSTIVHGGNWESKVNDLIKRRIFSN